MHVAIIGARLSRLSLALALNKVNKPSPANKVRSADYVQGGAVVLSTNVLRLLDRVGIYEGIRSKDYHFQGLTFKNGSDETTDIYYFGNEKLYCSKALRTYPKILIDELKTVLE